MDRQKQLDTVGIINWKLKPQMERKMSLKNWLKKASFFQNTIILLCLAGAVYSAYNVGNPLSWAGIVYYALCAFAVLRRDSRALPMLLVAVGIHAGLISYSLWQWKELKTIPCHYCFAAAGFVLAAAVTRMKLPAVILPLMVMVGVGFAWPWIFAVQQVPPNAQPTAVQTKIPVQKNSGVTVDSSESSQSMGSNKAKTSPAKNHELSKKTNLPQTSTPVQNNTPDQAPETNAPTENAIEPEPQNKPEEPPEENVEGGHPAEPPPQSG